ncbi:MAG: hypothetical protein K2P45_14975 [Eubacterium sp.]|nr:hypothetical protein [Eubacterium sp.]
MNFQDEKDYLMRIIKEVISILISLTLGKKYTQVELPDENKYDLSDEDLSSLKAMIDRGEINEAENMLLSDGTTPIDRQSIAKLIFFYEYTSQKSDRFLQEHNYTREEVLEGLKLLAKNIGYKNITDFIDV